MDVHTFSFNFLFIEWVGLGVINTCMYAYNMIIHIPTLKNNIAIRQVIMLCCVHFIFIECFHLSSYSFSFILYSVVVYIIIYHHFKDHHL